MLYSNQGGSEATDSTTAPHLTGPLAEALGLCTASKSVSVRPSDRESGCLGFPPSQRILFYTRQMFGAVCRTTLSCVYNKEVLAWRRREGSEVRELVLLWRGGVHCAVGVNTG